MKFKKTFFLALIFISCSFVEAQNIKINWQPREDLNISLPNSIKIFSGEGKLLDGKTIRTTYVEIDMNDENLKLRSIGNKKIRETTKETLEKVNGIFAINSGYYTKDSKSSIIVQDGETVSTGLDNEIIRGAFGMLGNIPKIDWVNSDENGVLKKHIKPNLNSTSEVWNVNQAIAAGPILLKNGKKNITDTEEKFDSNFIQRHPRSAIGIKDINTLIFLVVDGRQKASVGVTLEELSQILLSLDVDEALNLDGGGSSTMVTPNEVVNIPSNIDGGDRNNLRKNGSALVISEIKPSQFPKPIIFDADSNSYSEQGIWKNSNHKNYYGNTNSRVAISNDVNRAFYNFKDILRKPYQLSVWFTSNIDTSKEVNYILHSEGKSDTIKINQSLNRNLGKWNILGNFVIDPKDSLEITSTKRGKYTVDAIRLIPSKNLPEIPKRGETRIAIISDLNSSLGTANYEWQIDSIISRIPRIWSPDLVICGGDMVAGMGISDREQLQTMWDGFDNHIAKPLKKHNIPFAFTLGNHDGPKSYPMERDFARVFWNKHKNRPDLKFVDDSNFPNYYSFIHDDIFFVSWEASSPEISSENLNWLDKQFQTQEAKKSKLRFVMGHMPLYSVAQGRDSKGNVLENPNKLRKLLNKYDVHTYISGHQHAYYPGKRGPLELLNAGAAGSGPRSWLTQNHKPVNTITIMDVFNDKDSINYTTYNIKHKKASDMSIFNEHALPSAMFGVNGYVKRRDINNTKRYTGKLSSLNTNGIDIAGNGYVRANIVNKNLEIYGEYYDLKSNISKQNSVGIYFGRHTEEGKLLQHLELKYSKGGSGRFEGKLRLSENLLDYLSIGSLYVKIKTKKGDLRTQLYPTNNSAPEPTSIISHHFKNTYAVRDTKALYKLDWEQSIDKDGDFVSYIYQVSKNDDFTNIVFEEKTGRNPFVKLPERVLFNLLSTKEFGKREMFYHRVITSDGSHISLSSVTALKLMKTEEENENFVEISAPRYLFKRKIKDSSAGYGAGWDKDGKLWLADYNKGFHIINKDGEKVDFSPLTSVSIKGKTYKLNPVNGIGIDLDGHILAAINRKLIKINSETGQGIAVWEVPRNARAITTPRVTNDGEIYVTALFGEDANYVLRQNSDKTFKLIRSFELKNRNLARTFDMSADGKTLYFPNPGAAKIQVYNSNDGISYKKQKDITSISAGSSAIKVMGNSIFLAVRSSGISPSSFHYINNNSKEIWTLELPEVDGSEPRGIVVSKDKKELIFCSWDGGYYFFEAGDLK